jgi:hypothetical protein
MLAFKKSLTLIFIATLLAGCNARIDAMKETIAYSISGAPDVSLSDDEIANLKYASQYIKLQEQPRAMVVLGFDDKSDYHWLSGEGEVVVTRFGRLARTSGLDKENDNIEHDIRYLAQSNNDPLKCFVTNANYKSCSKTWSTLVEVGDGSHAKRFSINSEITSVTPEVMKLKTGEQVEAIKVEETLKVSRNNRDYQFQNEFWLDKQNQRVLKSRQGLVPGFPIMTMEELKPYPADLKARQ